MRPLMPIKPSLVSAWTGRTWGRCWCLTQCSSGFWVSVVCPGTSAEVEKMGCTAEINPLPAPAERGAVWTGCLAVLKVKLVIFVGTAGLPQEMEWWAGQVRVPSLVAGRGEARSSALSARMRLFHQKSKILLPCGLYLLMPVVSEPEVSFSFLGCSLMSFKVHQTTESFCSFCFLHIPTTVALTNAVSWKRNQQ